MSWGPVCGPPSNKRTRPPSEWDRHVLLCCDSADSGSSRSAQWRDGTVRTAKQNRYTIGGDRQLVSLTACKINVIKQWWMLNIHERLCVSVDWLNLILPLLLGFSLSDAVLQKKRWRIVMMDGRRPHFCAFQHWRSHDLWLGSRLVSWLLMPLQLKLALSAYCTTIFLFQACLFFNFHIVVVGSSGFTRAFQKYRVAQKTGPPSHCKYSEIPWPNCVEIGEFLQYYMLNTVINFLFKNFIVLWRHLAKQLLSFIHILQIDLSITQ